jgi:hypothetical protein
MLRKSSLLLQPNSGFVPFSGGGTVDEALLDAALARARAKAPTEVESTDLRGMRQMVWMPGTAVRVRGVEMAVIAAICGYFTFGLGKVLGLL